MVVGDDDQSIYSWRGADIRNILEFEKDYPDAKVVKLEQNYRSTVNILTAANAVIAHNTGRKAKRSTPRTPRASASPPTSPPTSATRPASWPPRSTGSCAQATTRTATWRCSTAPTRSRECWKTCFSEPACPYRIVGGTRFFDRAEIRDVMAYLKVVVNPADEISLRRIINTPRRGIGDTTIDKISSSPASAA